MHACLHVVTHHFLQDCVTIFQLTCRSGAWSLVPAFQNDKVYLSVFWYAQRKLGLTAGGGRKRGATTSSPPRTTQNVILPLAAARAQPSCWKEQTFKTLWHVSQALPLSQCHWWSWNWQAPSHRSWLGDTPSLVCVTSYPRQGRIPSCHTNTNCIMGWAGSAEAGWHMLDMRLCACEGMNGMPGIMDSRLIKVGATDLPVGNALFDPELSHCRCSLGTSWLNKWHATSSEQISDILL